MLTNCKHFFPIFAPSAFCLWVAITIKIKSVDVVVKFKKTSIFNIIIMCCGLMVDLSL